MLPVMSGLAATEHIMAHCPTPILVVSSSFNRGELFKTYDALAAGAVDVLEKPTGDEPEGDWERRFLATVKLVSRIRVITHLRAAPPDQCREHRRLASADRRCPQPAPSSWSRSAPPPAGPARSSSCCASLPASISLPVLLVLHISPLSGHAFADWLDGQIALARQLRARRRAGRRELAGRVVMAPPERHLLVRDGRLRLDDGPERHSCRPSVDVLFEFVAARVRQIAVGARCSPAWAAMAPKGLLAMRGAGGTTIAQDEATSVVYGMPREAVLLGARIARPAARRDRAGARRAGPARGRSWHDRAPSSSSTTA